MKWLGRLAPYSKAVVAVAALAVYVLARLVGVDLGELSGVAIEADVLILMLVEAFAVYQVPNVESTEVE